MLDVKGELQTIARKREADPKPKRYVELYTAMLNREVSLQSMNNVCYAIGTIHREAGLVRTDRVIGKKPEDLSKDAKSEKKRKWRQKAHAYLYPLERNEDDKEWLEDISENMGDSYELTEEEQHWVHYILGIPLQADIAFGESETKE